MIRYFSKKNKGLALLFIFLFLCIPIFQIQAAELNSTNYTIDEYEFDTGGDMNSTNFSVTGNVTQGHKGYFTSSSLPLVPGVITSCGKITASGTYTLGANLTDITGNCFSVQANDVTIDGDGYTVIAANSNTSYAVIATSTGAAASAYGTTTISNITFAGFAGGVNASGNSAVSGNTDGGNGGSVIIASSTLGAILTSAGLGAGTGSIGDGAYVSVINSTTGNITNTGLNGTIALEGADLDISNTIYTTSGSGTFSLIYSGTLTTTNTTLSAVSHFVIQEVDYGNYAGGAFPLFPSTINTCGSLYFAGTYTFAGDITGNCNIIGTGVILEGAGHTLTGNVTANNKGVTLSNIDVTGAVSTTGATPGALVINNAANLTGTINVTGVISGDGSGSLANTTISAGGSVATSSVSFVGDIINNGTINSGISVVGKTTNNATIYTGGSIFTFNASSTNSGTVFGDAVFSASSTNSGTVTEDATFNAYTAVNGEIIFSGTEAFSGTGYVGGTVYDSIGTTNLMWVFTASSTNTGVISGDATFTDTSSNTLTGIIEGDAIFEDSSTNLGTVTGNSEVYSPVVRPLGGTTNGQVIYRNYDGLYFHDSAVGHGVTGKWDDIDNWWVDVNATIGSPIIPTEGDDAIILSGTISTTTDTAHVQTITFENSSSNEISITVESTERDAALFNDSSVNDGTIVGNATFAGEDSVNNGTVTGYITRQYSTGIFTVLEDFTHNGVHWIIQAINGATVDLTGATYSLIDNIFEALGNAIFIFNNGIGGSVPTLTITSPTSGNNIKWKPVISWGTSTLCQYKIDGGLYTSVVCANNGSDIPRPAVGAHTISFKSTDAEGNVAEKSLTFTYDNTQPVDTDCSTPLDEVTRPYYYLTSNVGSCSITASTTLRGDNNGGGEFYTVANITGSSTNVILQNITATGTVSGFNTLTVASSTIAATTTVAGSLYADTLSTFTNGVVNSGATVYGGMFTGNLTNNGTIINSTTTPVTVEGSTTNNGTITNGFIFNASSTNNGTVNGTTTLNGSAVNYGTVNGDLIFNTLTAVSGIVTISDNTVFLGTGTTTGDILDNRDEEISVWLFEDSSTNLGLTKGTVYFDGASSNLGTVQGDAYFDDTSTNSGVVTGDAYKYKTWLIAGELGGTVQGSITYYSYPNSVSFRNISGDNNWNNLSNWFMFATTTVPLGRTPSTGEDIVLFASTTLKSNLTNDIYIAADDITIIGANYTVGGSILGNGAYGGSDAYDFNLQYITVTGTTTAMGGDGNPDVDGGDGGNLDIRYSTTNVITINGGDPLHNGGDAGTLYVFNTLALEENTPILAKGGDSVGCGFGGSGGNVTLVNTSGYILHLDPGQSATSTIAQGGGCENPPSGNNPTRGQSSVSGEYNPSLNEYEGEDSTPQQPTDNSSSPSTSSNLQDVIDRFVPVVTFDINLPDFNLIPLPSFGTGGENSFSFISRIKNFFAAPIPQEILEKFQSMPTLFSSLGISNMNDLLALRKKPFLLENTKSVGLFSVYSKTATTPLDTYIKFNITETLFQTVQATSEQQIVITLIPIINNSNYEAIFNGEKVYFSNNKLELTVPKNPGVYTLSTGVSPMVLKIEVTDTNNIEYSISERTVNLFTIVIESTTTTVAFIKDTVIHVVSAVVDIAAGIFKAVIGFFSGLFK